MPNINKNIIKQAGAAVANATNKAAGLSSSTPEPGTIISAIQLVNGGREIGPADVAHFTESVRNKLLSLLVSMEPIQDFNGYGNPWPGGGGKNLLDPSLYAWQTMTNRPAGITWTVQPDGSVKVEGTSSGTGGYNIIFPGNLILPNGTYYFKTDEGGVTFTYRKQVKGTSLTSVLSNPFTVDDDFNAQYEIYVGVYCNTAGTYDTTIYPIIQACPITEWTPYANICPISGRTGANAYVSPTPNVADATTYAADWTTPAGTVYAGSADIVNGDIKAAPYYASYNGETLVGPWVSSMDVYDPEGTPTTGAQVVDLGGTMTEYQITGQDVITLVGDNYIWSDSGDVTITE